MYSRGWGSSAWLKISSGRFVTVAALLCALSTGRAQYNHGFRASCTLSRFVKLPPRPPKEARVGPAIDSLESSWTSTSLGGASARLVSPIKLSMNYLFSFERVKERKRERGGGRWNGGPRRTDIANTGGTQNRFIRMYLSDPFHSSFSIPPYFNPLPLLSPCSRNY